MVVACIVYDNSKFFPGLATGLSELFEKFTKRFRIEFARFSSIVKLTIRHRFGLPPCQGKEQSVISISEVYGVTRGSIYQLEKSALKNGACHFLLIQFERRKLPDVARISI